MANPIPEDLTLVPWAAVLAVAGLMTDKLAGGDKTRDGWRGLPREEHVARMIRHGILYLLGDGTDTHLHNAACRALMALDQAMPERP